jgi:hypothetical protein
MVFDIIPESLSRSPSAALAVLASMITPALLLSATGTFLLSTSQRLGRVIDRTRKLSDAMEELMQRNRKDEMFLERRSAMFAMIEIQIRRANLLGRAMVVFYVAAGLFVATSVAIGAISLYRPSAAWIPLLFGLSGAVLMFLGSLVLISEARLAVRSLRGETSFLAKLAQFHHKQDLS